MVQPTDHIHIIRFLPRLLPRLRGTYEHRELKDKSQIKKNQKVISCADHFQSWRHSVTFCAPEAKANALNAELKNEPEAERAMPTIHIHFHVHDYEFHIHVHGMFMIMHADHSG